MDIIMANLKDVAKKAMVSTATVSYVINNTRHVSDEKRKRVLKVIDELGYQPNRFAQGLRSKKPNTVGLVLSNLRGQFYADLVETVEHLLYEYGYSVLICNSGDDPGKEKLYFSMLAANSLSGIIIAPSPGSLVKQPSEQNLPTVAIHRDYEYNNGPAVLLDNCKLSCEAVCHLIERHGYRDIAAISDDLRMQNVYNRYLGYCETMTAYNLPVCHYSTNEHGGNMWLIQKLIRQGQLPQAVFITATQPYFETFRSLRTLGIKVPEQVAMIGFNDSPHTAYFDPPLSVINTPTSQMAQRAVHELLELMNGRLVAKKTIIVDTEVTYRASCGCPS